MSGGAWVRHARGARAVRGWLGVVAVLAGQTAAGAAQQPGVISGEVVDGISGKPVSAAVVSIAGAGMTVNVGSAPLGPRILTGTDGRFVFRGLPVPGGFTIAAVRNGYADGASGRRRPGGASQPVALTEQQRSIDLVVRVWKNGAIAGTVTDEAGEPVVGLRVRVAQRQTIGGRRQYVPVDSPAATDDRGLYRASNLPAGDYIVLVSPPGVSARTSMFEDIARTGRANGEIAQFFGGPAQSSRVVQVGDALYSAGRGGATPPPPSGSRLRIYPPTFAPSAAAPAQAAVATLAPGEERTGFDIQLSPVAAVRVAGTLVSPADAPSATILRLLQPAMPDVPLEALAPGAATDASGAFVFAAVPAGQYLLRAAVRSGNGNLWAELPVSVSDADIEGLTLLLRPGLAVSGRVEFEGSAERPKGAAFAPGSLLLESVDGLNAPRQVNGEWQSGAGATPGRFRLPGFGGGRYLLRVNSPPGWMFKSAMLNGVDVSTTPFDLTRDIDDLVVTFTDQWTGIGGVVQGTGADTAAVLVFPTDARGWENYGLSPRRLRSTRTNGRGEFGFSSLPAGDYYAIALSDDQAGDWRDPRTLETLARAATRVTLADGEQKTITLPLRDIR